MLTINTPLCFCGQVATACTYILQDYFYWTISLNGTYGVIEKTHCAVHLTYDKSQMEISHNVTAQRFANVAWRAGEQA